MRILFLIILAAIIFSCNQGSGNQAVASQSGQPTYEQYCESFNTVLNGVFANKTMEGTMTWSGGVKGQVQITGVDYNEMTCTYEITDCSNGSITMFCDGSGYNTSISLMTPDSIWVGQTPYFRVK